MTAFRDDTDAIQQQIGPIRSSEELKEAILSGAVASITPEGNWLVAWMDAQGIEALEFVPIDCCKERWPLATKDIPGKAITIEVHCGGGTYTFVHPPKNETR